MALLPVSKDSATLADFLHLLRQRKALIALVLAVVLVTTLAVTAFLPKWYLSTTKIRVEKPEGEVKLFQAQSSSYYDPYFLQDQFKILQSEKILYPVIENLGLNVKLGAELGSSAPLTPAISFRYLLDKMLRVESQRSSSLIEINVYSQNPALAASIANEIAHVYSDDRISLATQEQVDGIAQLKKELAAQEKIVSEQRDLVEKVRTELKVAGVDLNAPTTDLDIETLRSMQASAIALSADVTGRKIRYENLKSIAPDDRFKVINSETFQDTSILNLHDSYLQAEQEVAKLKGRLGEAHPDLAAATGRQALLRKQLNDKLDGYVASLGNSYKEAQGRLDDLNSKLKQAKADQIVSARDQKRPFEEARQAFDNASRVRDVLSTTLRQREIDFTSPKKTIEILNTAEAARQSSKPNWALNIVFAVLFGGILGVGIAVSLEYFDTSFRSVADVESRLKLPVLGIIPFAPDPDDSEGDPSETEPYRVLHTNLNLGLKPGKPASFAMFSAGPGEGKSTTLHRLALVMAGAGEKVILIDSDLRRPTQHRLANRPKEPGLSDLLAGKKDLDGVIQPGIAPNLDFIASGSIGGFTLGLLYANRLRSLIDELGGRYNRIIFDSPPIIGVSDSSVLAGAVDGAVLLIQHRRNPASMVLRAQQILTGLKTPVLGVVLNQVPLNSGDDYGYYTNNYTYYSEGRKKTRKSSRKKGAPGDSEDRIDLKE